jgi:hypothetical protein
MPAVSSVRPPVLADLDAAALHSAQVLADPAATFEAKQAAIDAEQALYARWLAAIPDADATIQRDAELQPAGGVNYPAPVPDREAEAG